MTKIKKRPKTSKTANKKKRASPTPKVFREKTVDTAPQNKRVTLSKEQAADLAIQFMQKGDLQNAEKIAIHILKAAPNHIQALNIMGALLHKKGEYERGITFVDQALAINPQEAYAHIIKGLLLKKTGKLNLAAESLQTAIDIEPDNPEAYLNLTSILSAMESYEDAEKNALKAIELDPDYAEAYFNLGNAVFKQERVKEAVVWFEKSIRLNDNLVKAHQQLGNACNRLGHRQKARKHLNKALELDPADLDTHYMLANSQRYSSVTLQFRQIEHLIRSEKLSSESKLLAHFALGKMYADAKQHDIAFEHYRRGNQYRTLTTTPFLPEKHTTFVSTLMQTCDTPFFAKYQGSGLETTCPIFIVGMPRSGTTLVEQIIASHPLVHGAGELPFMQECFDDILVENLHKSFQHTLNEVSMEKLSSLASQYISKLPPVSSGIVHITDKMPGNFELLWLIALLFPRARIIHCKRHPMDTCISCFTKHFIQGHNYTNKLEWLGSFYTNYQRLMAHWHHVLPMDILDVQYEELVRDFKGTALRMLQHCGLEWDDRCMEYYKEERDVKTASMSQVRKPIYSSSVNRWKIYEKQMKPLKNILGL